MCIARYADVLGLLGRLCLAQGDYEGGEEYLMKGLAAYEKYTHSNHPAVGVITQGLAELYSSRRKYAKVALRSSCSAVPARCLGMTDALPSPGRSHGEEDCHGAASVLRLESPAVRLRFSDVVYGASPARERLRGRRDAGKAGQDPGKAYYLLHGVCDMLIQRVVLSGHVPRFGCRGSQAAGQNDDGRHRGRDRVAGHRRLAWRDEEQPQDLCHASDGQPSCVALACARGGVRRGRRTRQPTQK
eukprot:1303047-Rhodomonas_salina.3